MLTLHSTCRKTLFLLLPINCLIFLSCHLEAAHIRTHPQAPITSFFSHYAEWKKGQAVKGNCEREWLYLLFETKMRLKDGTVLPFSSLQMFIQYRQSQKWNRIVELQEKSSAFSFLFIVTLFCAVMEFLQWFFRNYHTSFCPGGCLVQVLSR